MNEQGMLPILLGILVLGVLTLYCQSQIKAPLSGEPFLVESL